MERLFDRLAALLAVKTIVTLMVMAVFVILALRREIEPQASMQVVTVVLAFYFGTQHEKKR